MDKTMLVRLSDKTSLNPALITFVCFGAHLGELKAAIYFGGGEDDDYLTVVGDEALAFERWLANHSTNDYLPGHLQRHYAENARGPADD